MTIWKGCVFVTASAAHPIEIHPPSGFSPGVGKTRSTLLESRFFVSLCAIACMHAVARSSSPDYTQSKVRDLICLELAQCRPWNSSTMHRCDYRAHEFLSAAAWASYQSRVHREKERANKYHSMPTFVTRFVWNIKHSAFATWNACCVRHSSLSLRSPAATEIPIGRLLRRDLSFIQAHKK